MRTESFLALNPKGFHRVVYHEWGSQENQRVLVCVHGLARNSRDFDELAQTLARNYRVVCPDIVGRGESDWLPAGCRYEIPQYVNDMVALLARLKVDQVDWLGTSMGGLIGMVLASQPNTPIRRLILNDIGAFVSHQALERIGGYVGTRQRFESLDEFEAELRRLYPAFEGISDRQWRLLAQHGCRSCDDGKLVFHYDPVVGDHTREGALADVDLWPLWESIRQPQLLLWGEDSDVLEQTTVERMCTNPALSLSRWPGVAHAPSLMEAAQIQTIVDWLRHPRY
ncbi:alpha/beta fold hydrolase [Motiliproteus sediminis]|uniref:alpha/beta fold hydrolase n=1 Tax=Motiliproteus sediminis TaxID=1468178 RepID=UPI001AEFE7B8|nr:alpha/beta hydrolase [Motiliproteus sediminis]